MVKNSSFGYKFNAKEQINRRTINYTKEISRTIDSFNETYGMPITK